MKKFYEIMKKQKREFVELFKEDILYVVKYGLICDKFCEAFQGLPVQVSYIPLVLKISTIGYVVLFIPTVIGRMFSIDKINNFEILTYFRQNLLAIAMFQMIALANISINKR